MSDDYAIKIDCLTKSYKLYNSPAERLKELVHPFRKCYHHDFQALNGVSFDIKKGETVGIIGKNGSGKSTLLKLITGVLTPTSGSIMVNGKVSALLELGAGFNPELTGLENIYFYGIISGLTRGEIDSKLDDILSFADIGEYVYQPVKTYSSGMFVRLAFAVVAHVDADILIVDEALSVGDAFFVQKCMRFLRAFMESGTILFVSHDIGATVSLCNKAVWLHNGKVEVVGEPKKVTEFYLENMYEAQQGLRTDQRSNLTTRDVTKPISLRDMRLDFINQSKFRNDIELFSFYPESQCFGKGGIKITDVRLQDDLENQLSWVVGGEFVRLLVLCVALDSIFSPIVGFMVKDRLGQTVFADNTYLTYLTSSLNILSGVSFQAIFSFNMPILPLGDYTITIAVAEGSQVEHVQHQWIHEALAFKVHSSSVCNGLVGIPMHDIQLQVIK